MKQPSLALDALSISPAELSIPALMRELDLQHRPLWLLRVLMNALETKRQEKGLGWSRPWNKVGLNVFRTHRQERTGDEAYVGPIAAYLDALLDEVSPEAARFARELLADADRMTFTFYHNRTEGERQFEGLTLSFGRRVKGDASKRDRLDLILEDVRLEGCVDGRVDLVRLYICPWDQYQHGREHTVLSRSVGSLPAGTHALYDHAVEYYHCWKQEEARQWSHWSAQAIDYFGPRSFIPQGTSFF